jgi:RHS repeat-associated protein
MLKVFRDKGSSQNWDTFYSYDGQGRVVLVASPSAVIGYDEGSPDLLNKQGDTYQYLQYNLGQILITDYATAGSAGETTPGDASGYFKDWQLQLGQLGTPIQLGSSLYFAHSASGATVYPLAASTHYANTDGTGAETTSYNYTWFPNTTQVQSVTTIRPVATPDQNGPGTPDVITSFFDIFAELTWTKDGGGFIHYTAHDPTTGAVTRTITDVDTRRTGDFTNLPPGWVTPPGGGLHLVTQTDVDALGRPTKVTDANQNVTYTVYNDPKHEVRTYRGWNSSTNGPTGPTEVSRQDRAGSYTEMLTMSAAPALDGSKHPTGAEDYSSIQTLARSYTNSAGQVVNQDSYFNLSGLTWSSSTTLGTENVNFYRTRWAYDDRGRLSQVLDPTGTLTRADYDGLGRVVHLWVGTTPQNQVLVSDRQYDQGGVGDGNLTQLTEYPGGGAAPRVTQYYYDWRGRLVASKGGVQTTEDTTTHRPILYFDYDNLGRVTAQERYDGDGVSVTIGNDGVPVRPDPSLLRARSTAEYDRQDRVFRTHTFSVDPGSGSVSGSSLTTDTWYDRLGRVIKTAQPGGLVSKTQYDGAGRVVRTYTTDGLGDKTWADAGTVATNTVLNQSEMQYDGNGNTLLVTSKQRFHDANNTGELSIGNARVSYTASYYDAANRLIATVDAGTNGGTAYKRPPSVPARSDSDPVLITGYSYQGDSVQQVGLTGGPTGGTFTLTFNGQTTAPIAYNGTAAAVQSALQALTTIGAGNALVAGPAGGPWTVRFAGALAGSVQPALTGNGAKLTGGTPSSVAVVVNSLGGDAGRVQQVTDPRGIVAKTDYDALGRAVRKVEAFANFNPTPSTDRTTEFSYDGANHVRTQTARLPGGGAQTTEYVYGVTTTGGSMVNSNLLLAAIKYPDKITGQPSDAEKDTFTVNALGQNLTCTDRNQTVHSYGYDVLGRLTSDAVTIPSTSAVDRSVQRLERAFDGQGNAYLFTSYNATSGGKVVNQVQRQFNGLGQLITEYQFHGDPANPQTPQGVVQYAYSEMAGGANHSRLVSMTYPNGRILHYGYNSGLDDRISRLSFLADDDGAGGIGIHLEEYNYLGLNTVVKRGHPEPGVDLSYINLSTGSSDGGDQYNGLDRFGRVVDQYWGPSGSPTDNFTYTYDRDSNRLNRNNLGNGSFNEQYGYDALNRLTTFSRGSHTQGWDLDALGNWNTITTDSIPQNRTHNQQNQITSISPPSTTPTYDNNGNTTTDDHGQVYVYDAWNRLVQATDASGTPLAAYAFDALGRRILETNQLSGTTSDLYFSTDWQVIEEQVGGVMQAQYVWSPVYVDALVERDTANGPRLYAQQDANWNVTALVDTTGTVRERYVYDPYGAVTVLDPVTWLPTDPTTYQMTYLHQGGRYDRATGLYLFRNREYSPTLGRWLQQDPIGIWGDPMNRGNGYAYVGDGPLNRTDPLGKQDPQQGLTQQDRENIDRLQEDPIEVRDKATNELIERSKQDPAVKKAIYEETQKSGDPEVRARGQMILDHATPKPPEPLPVPWWFPWGFFWGFPWGPIPWGPPPLRCSCSS